MGRARLLTVATAALLLEAIPLVVAHGHGDEPAEGGMELPDAPPPGVVDFNYLPSYWSLSEHASLMFWHIGLEMVAWFIILPVGR
jgi:hypothetical protein